MELTKAVAALSALAQESRLKTFLLLVRKGSNGMAAGDIAEELDIPAATLSFHLKELTRAGLLESRREGRSVRYALRVEGMQEFLRFLSQDCCQGHPELCVPVPGRSRAKRA
jgi:ArsR family transcriptional regulator